MWKIGNVSIPNRLIAAPLAGISNPVYRKMCHMYGAGLTVSEMISDKALHYDSQKTKEMCKTIEEDHPVALQLFGSDVETMKEAAIYLDKETDCDIIDINMGCPVPKVIKSKAGSWLLQHEDIAEEIVRNLVEVTDKPIAAKIRIGWDKNNINCVSLAQRLEKAGLSAIAVHGRTKTQMYEGQSDNQYIKMVKDSVSIPVIGNGDIRTVEDAQRMFDETGCDAIMIGRGLLGKPFFLEELTCHFNNQPYTPPTINERLDICYRYAKDLCEYEGQYTGIRMMRSMGPWFLTGMPNGAKYKNQMSSLETLLELEILLDKYRSENDI